MYKVLVVEDNELNLKLFKDLLATRNYEIIESRDGKDLIPLVEKDRPNLILMDIQLDGISGIELIKELKGHAATSKIPIIAVTAFAMKKDEIKITESGCDMYLSKPVSIVDFFQAVDKFALAEQGGSA